jgi:hypothetical protein
MEYTEFMKELAQKVQDYLEDEEKAELCSTLKNNGIVLEGLTITREGVQACPVIYLKDYYRDYQKDKDLDSCALHIIDSYKKACESPVMNFPGILHWGDIKNKLRIMLVNYEMNEDSLSGYPYEKFLDLAITYYLILSVTGEGSASVRVTNSLLSSWRITEEELKDTAYENMMKYDYPVIESMDDIMMKMMRRNFEKEFIDDEYDIDAIIEGMISGMVKGYSCNMYVMTNQTRTKGAGSLLCREALQGFAERIGNGFYILPSSLHELILVPYEEDCSVKKLKQMVGEVNHSEVAEDEVLSDKVYYYDRDRKEVKIAA